MSSSASSLVPPFAPFESPRAALPSSNSTAIPTDAQPSGQTDAHCYTWTEVKKKRSKSTTPAAEPTVGTDPFATVPDGQILIEEARLAAGLAAAVDNEAPTRPMDPLSPSMTPDAETASDDASGGVDGRSTGKSNRPTSTMDAGTIDPTRGIETFGRRAHNAYMPPDPNQPVPGQWAGHDQAGGYAPAPHVWQQSQPREWADPVQPPTAWQGYPQQPQSVYVPADSTNHYAQAPRSTAQLGLKPNFAAMMCYLPYLGIVGSILVQQNEPKENRFVHFHARQSLIAHVVFWAVTIAFAIAQAAAPRIASVLIGIGSSLFHLGAVVGFVWMMVRVYQGRADKIPVIGEQVDV